MQQYIKDKIKLIEQSIRTVHCPKCKFTTNYNFQDRFNTKIINSLFA